MFSMFWFWTRKTTHQYLAMIHLVSAIAMFNFKSLSNVTIYTSKDKYEINICAANGTFLALTAVAHLFYSFNDEFSKQYRWIEYGISAPILFVVIAILSGIRNLLTLVALFGLMSTTMRFGRYQDVSEETDWKKAPFWDGFIPYAFAWAVVFYQFFISAEQNNAPSFVYPIIVVTFLFYSSFSVVQWYYTVKTRKNVDAEDSAMIVLSLLSKLVLSYWILGGIMNIQDDASIQDKSAWTRSST